MLVPHSGDNPYPGASPSVRIVTAPLINGCCFGFSGEFGLFSQHAQQAPGGARSAMISTAHLKTSHVFFDISRAVVLLTAWLMFALLNEEIKSCRHEGVCVHITYRYNRATTQYKVGVGVIYRYNTDTTQYRGGASYIGIILTPQSRGLIYRYNTDTTK